MAEYDVEIRQVVKEFIAPGGKFPVRAVDCIDLNIERGEFFALLGPSGCGKTTTLRLIAGFEQPSAGKILIRGKEMQGIPPFHRPVNTVFQDYALFPHMTVVQNVMFGLEMENVAKKEARARAEQALEMVRLPHVAQRRPTQLSGGQQQRVALARALVKRPALLLLDEPLGALDLKLRKEMQYELKSMQQQVGITFIFVTHDQEEAMTMADRIAVMDQGKVLQVGNAREIYEHPATHFVADFIGETNFVPGHLLEKNGRVGKVRLGDETIIQAQLPENNERIVEGNVSVLVRPERIGLMPWNLENALPETGNLSVIKGTIVDSYYIGTDTRYKVRIGGNADIIVRVQNMDYPSEYSWQYNFQNGEEVKVFWPLASTTILEE